MYFLFGDKNASMGLLFGEISQKFGKYKSLNIESGIMNLLSLIEIVKLSNTETVGVSHVSPKISFEFIDKI
ncbi:MAG: hypothetical protein IPK57_10715 [Chitinophagaceae bacterium]|nr:hypothetical protein [Chitinophagaceae bacterium]